MSRLVLTAITAYLVTGALALAADPPLGDPMRPYSPASPAAGDQRAARPFRLTGVLIAATRRVAVINGALYREGDTVNGARVVRIERDSVQLRRGNENLTLQLQRRSGQGRSGQRRTGITRTNNPRTDNGESVQ